MQLSIYQAFLEYPLIGFSNKTDAFLTDVM